MFAGIYILWALVTSNAYKGINIYQMLLPRTYLVYKSIEQLTGNTFTTYAKAIPDIKFTPHDLVQIFTGNNTETSKGIFANGLQIL